jgi:hypothetical protein
MRWILFSIFFVMCTALPADKPDKLIVSVQTPHPGFGLEILRVDRLGERVQVLARIHAPEDSGMMFPMVISDASDTVFVEEPVAAVKVIVTGRTWGWGDEEAVESPEAYAERFPDAVPIPFVRNREE